MRIYPLPWYACNLMKNIGTYHSLLYPFVYMETENGKAPTLPNDQLQLGKLCKGQDLKPKMAFIRLTGYGIFWPSKIPQLIM